MKEYMQSKLGFTQRVGGERNVNPSNKNCPLAKTIHTRESRHGQRGGMKVVTHGGTTRYFGIQKMILKHT